MKKFLTLVLLLSVVSCLYYSAYAQENPYALETKVIQNQQQIKILQQQEAQLYLKIDNLLVKYGEIKGELDDIQHRLDSIQNQINQLLLRNTTVNSSLPASQAVAPKSPNKNPSPKNGTQPILPNNSKINTTGNSLGNNSKAVVSKNQSASVSEDQKAFDGALKLFKSKKYDEAIPAFKKFKDDFKDSKLIPDAIFYIAESYYEKGQYDKAIINYDYLVNTYQKCDKVPMATFEEGLAFIKMGDEIDGNYLLQKVIKQYPNSQAAKLAKEYLKKKR